MTPRPLTFTGKTTAVHFAPNAVIRITPDRQTRGALPPTGCIVPVETQSSIVNAEIVMSDRACIVFETWNRRWVATPLKPSETQGVASYPEGSGATDWVVRTEADI